MFGELDAHDSAMSCGPCDCRLHHPFGAEVQENSENELVESAEIVKTIGERAQEQNIARKVSEVQVVTTIPEFKDVDKPQVDAPAWIVFYLVPTRSFSMYLVDPWTFHQQTVTPCLHLFVHITLVPGYSLQELLLLWTVWQIDAVSG